MLDRERFIARYGPWALVAGASEGIGAEFARTLAARGLHLILVARRAGPLEALGAELRARDGVDVLTLARDLSDRGHLGEILDAVAGREVGLLVCNAALAPVGEFLSRPIDEHHALIDLNCRAATVLAHGLGREMVARRRGGIVLMSSLAGLQGSALVAHYAASKAYLRVLAEGLWRELGPQGLDVVVSLPGPTRTPTFEASRPSLLAEPQPAGEVVTETLEALGRRPVVVPGPLNRLAASLMRALPTSLAVRLVSRGTARMYGPGTPG